MGASAAAFSLAGCLGEEGDEDPDEIEIMWADHFPSGDFISLDLTSRRFMQEIEEETEGRVVFDYYPGGELGGSGETLGLIQEGAIDAGHVVPGYYSDLFPFSQIAELPGLSPSSAAGGQAIHELLMPHKDGYLAEQEWEEQNIRPLLTAQSPTYEVASVDEPIDSMEAFEGKSVRTGGGLADFTAEALGGSAVPMGAGEIYSSMERGTIDVDINGAHLWEAFGIYELFNYATRGAPLNTTVLVEAISMDTWESLPEDIQEVFIEKSDENPVVYGEGFDEYYDELYITMEEEQNIDTFELSSDEHARWEQTLQDEVVDPWVDNSPDPEIGDELLELYTGYLDDYS